MYLKSPYFWMKISQVKEKSEVTCEKKAENLLSNFDIYFYKALQPYTDISKLRRVVVLEWEMYLARALQNHIFI